MNNVLEQVYAVFGDAIPGEKHIFSATEKNLVTMTTVVKHFGSYDKFLTQYKTFCIQKRNAEAAAAVVTKPVAANKEVKKDETTKTS